MVAHSKPPNILFIMSDDHAAHAMSCYGSRINQTPNIDRIANEGVRFDNCFCTNSLCAPSRASILTGTYNHINGVTTLETTLENSILAFPQLLQNAGYQTAIVGKWHLGHGPRYDPFGFDYWCILPGQGDYFNPPMYEMGTKKQFKGYATDIITDLALDWLKRRDKDRPFCLMVTHKAPHRPWSSDEKHSHLYEDIELPPPETFNDDYSNRASAATSARMRIARDLNAEDLRVEPPPNCGFYEPVPVPEKLEGYSLTNEDGKQLTFKSQQELKNWKYQQYIKNYLRCVAAIDDNVGRLLDFLDVEGLALDTIVIYTSDQGFFLGDHGWFDKRFMYEESLRMPFILRYPQNVAAGGVVKEIILNVDFSALFLDFGGVPVPAQMQGRSFRPLLQGHAPPDWRQAIYYRYWANGTFHNVHAHYGIRTLQYKLIYYYDDPLGQKGAARDPEHRKPQLEWELFNLAKDPHELHNVYRDPAYVEVVQELKVELHRLQKAVGDVPYKKEID